jgi:hypothetical protein
MAAPAALACGYCDEDRIAAVYDHTVIGKALDRHHEVAFFAIEGHCGQATNRGASSKGRWQRKTAIDLPSLRVSVDSASLSLAYDGGALSRERIGDAMNRRLAAHGLGVSLLKVIAERTAGPGI